MPVQYRHKSFLTYLTCWLNMYMWKPRIQMCSASLLVPLALRPQLLYPNTQPQIFTWLDLRNTLSCSSWKARPEKTLSLLILSRDQFEPSLLCRIIPSANYHPISMRRQGPVIPLVVINIAYQMHRCVSKVLLLALLM